MQIHLTEGEIVKARLKNIPDLHAYHKFLKALEHFRHSTKESNILAQKEAEELLELNPNVSEMHSFLGSVYLQQITIGACESDLICFAKATEATRNALSLDQNNSDAHMLASFLFLLKNEHEKAIAEGKNAIMLNPNNADAYATLGWSLVLADRSVEAIGIYKRAIRLNPIPPAWYLSNLAMAYRVSKQYEKAIETWEDCLKRQSDFWWAHLGLALAYDSLGREKEARAAIKQVQTINPDYSIEMFKKMPRRKNQTEYERVIEVLRKLGIPE
jgi:tetratricopeptide (TPR) repeat protein